MNTNKSTVDDVQSTGRMGLDNLWQKEKDSQLIV